MLDPTVMLMRSRRVRFKRMGNGSNGERGQIVKKRVLQTTYKTRPKHLRHAPTRAVSRSWKRRRWIGQAADQGSAKVLVTAAMVAGWTSSVALGERLTRPFQKRRHP